jgi:hypothetical protein
LREAKKRKRGIEKEEIRGGDEKNEREGKGKRL